MVQDVVILGRKGAYFLGDFQLGGKFRGGAPSYVKKPNGVTVTAPLIPFGDVGWYRNRRATNLVAQSPSPRESRPFDGLQDFNSQHLSLFPEVKVAVTAHPCPWPRKFLRRHTPIIQAPNTSSAQIAWMLWPTNGGWIFLGGAQTHFVKRSRTIQLCVRDNRHRSRSPIQPISQAHTPREPTYLAISFRPRTVIPCCWRTEAASSWASVRTTRP